MASAIHSENFGFCPPRPARARDAAAAARWLGSLARRVGDSLDAQGRREAERTMVRLLQQSGGRLTDSIEREMALNLFAPGGFGRR